MDQRFGEAREDRDSIRADLKSISQRLRRVEIDVGAIKGFLFGDKAIRQSIFEDDLAEDEVAEKSALAISA